MSKCDLNSIFTDFYTKEEITSAKKLILDIAEKIPARAEDANKIKTGVGDGKSRRHFDDILNLYTIMDGKKDTMPVFLAKDTARISSMKDVELSKITSQIADLKDKFNVKLELNKSINTEVDKLKAQVISTISNEMKEIHKSVV